MRHAATPETIERLTQMHSDLMQLRNLTYVLENYLNLLADAEYVTCRSGPKAVKDTIQLAGEDMIHYAEIINSLQLEGWNQVGGN